MNQNVRSPAFRRKFVSSNRCKYQPGYELPPEGRTTNWQRRTMYDYRKMTPAQRAEVVEYRRRTHRPLHAPPHEDSGRLSRYLITASCYEHQPVIGASPARMTACEEGVLSACRNFGAEVFAWCVLPNHYHLLVKSVRLKELTKELGRFHGRSSNAWNDEEDCRGRTVWHRCFDRRIRSERHFLGNRELCPSQSRLSRLRREVARLAMVQRGRVP